MARGFPDGVWFVSLASLGDPLLVTQAVFMALGAQDQSAGWSISALADHLSRKRALIVLDNCEHLLDACATLAASLLRECPNLRLLATSRQGLAVGGEVRMQLSPMSVPPVPGHDPVAGLVETDAVVLFAERAAAVVPEFEVTAENAASVLELCRRLDGIPLALELAAVRLGALSLDQLNRGLERELSVLGVANRGAETRQQTLEATIGWSYGLLQEKEQLLWARLSVFAGGFDTDAAIEVCSDDRLPSHRLVEHLGALVEKSVVKRAFHSGNRPRYWLLDTIGAYGRQRLRDINEEAITRKRHLKWVAGLARAVGAFDNRQAELFKRMDLERDNTWAALEYCLTDTEERSSAADIGQHLLVYWTCRGPFNDLRRMLGALTARIPEDQIARAYVLSASAAMGYSQNDFEASVALSRESQRIATKLQDPSALAICLTWLAVPLMVEGKTADALELAATAVSLARVAQSRPAELVATQLLCNALALDSQPERAIEVGQHGLALSRECGELWARGYLHMGTSQAYWLMGERNVAEAEAIQGVVSKHALDDRTGLQAVLEILASMAAERGAHRRAAVLLGSAEGVRQSSAIQFHEGFRQRHKRSIDLVLAGLGQRQFDAAYEQGMRMSTDDVVVFATSDKLPSRPVGVRTTTRAPLTKRELEIAHLIAQEMSSRDIAARLFLSERTVETHITNIFNKLGLNSRVQLIRWLGSFAVNEQANGL
jgi:predicted ATPase/DNA-binding CsgD family transcriptional regulator